MIIMLTSCGTKLVSIWCFADNPDIYIFEEGVICAGALAQYAGKAFRLGHMGNIDKNDMVAALGTVERCVKACGADVKLGTAVGTYLANME